MGRATGPRDSKASICPYLPIKAMINFKVTFEVTSCNATMGALSIGLATQEVMDDINEITRIDEITP